MMCRACGPRTKCLTAKFSLAANQFRIRELDGNPDQMFVRTCTQRLKQRAGGNRRRQLDWLKTVSLGEYNHPYYSLRRVWRSAGQTRASKNSTHGLRMNTHALTRSALSRSKAEAFRRFRIAPRPLRRHEFDMTKGVAYPAFG